MKTEIKDTHVIARLDVSKLKLRDIDEIRRFATENRLVAPNLFDWLLKFTANESPGALDIEAWLDDELALSQLAAIDLARQPMGDYARKFLLHLCYCIACEGATRLMKGKSLPAKFSTKTFLN